MIMFFDTETTGFPLKAGSSLTDPKQPTVLQLAMSVYDADRRPVFELSTMICVPPNLPIPSQAFDVHGISTALANAYGLEERTALALFNRYLGRTGRAVAHNLKYDEQLMNIMGARQDVPIKWGFKFCTMEASTHLVNLPPTPKMVAAGFKKPKPPTLTQLHTWLFGEGFEGAHDALIDTRACARCYFELVDRKLIT
jgi:DNA polymerase-3 subunit epsilon